MTNNRGRIRGRIGRLLLTPFGVAALGCLVFAGWALWSGGILDGPMARTVRTSSVYAAPGVGLDTAAAQQIIGNRRLVVIMLAPGADLRAGCHAVGRAAAGTLVFLLSRDGDDYDTYGCAQFPGGAESFGKAAVSEQVIGNGIDEFIDRPLGAVKVIAVNFDALVKAGLAPGDARTISPSLPRYLIAVAAAVAVVAGSVVLFAVAWRAGRLAAARRARRDRATDGRTVLSATAAVVAQQIIDLDPRYAVAVTPSGAGSRRAEQGPAATYRTLASDYTRLLDDISAADRRDETDFTQLTARAEALVEKLRALTP